MARLDTERQKELEPKRLELAKSEIEKLGYNVSSNGKNLLTFMFKGSIVEYWAYSGWHSGKNIKSGRGLVNLLNQIC